MRRDTSSSGRGASRRAVTPGPLMLAACVVALAAGPSDAAPMGAMGQYDIGALLSAADESFDLSSQDAVVLLDETSFVFESDGSVRRTVHSIVWMGTELGQDIYADLRVPYNAATSDIEVLSLRTWRDGSWWPAETELSQTAIVEATPYALQSAYDYDTIRDVMLLHDGVELPCVVETAYTVTEQRDTSLGADGMWVVPGSDPTVRKVLSITRPGGTTLHYTTVPGAPQPELTRAPEQIITCTWVADLVDRLPRPLTDDAIAYEPYVVWSTWPDWAALRDAMMGAIDEAAVLNDALRDSVAHAVEGRELGWTRAEALAKFVKESTRVVNYDNSFWKFRPRPAVRTWETAYGHRLDRTVLATALLREAGFTVTPVLRATGYSAIDRDVPALSWFEVVELTVGVDFLRAHFDPISCAVSVNGVDDARRATFSLGRGDRGPSDPDTYNLSSGFELTASLTRGDEGWSGAGQLRTFGVLSPYSDMLGVSGETDRFVNEVASSVLGASADGIGLAALEAMGVVATFDVKLEDQEPDDAGRTRLVIGDPSGGILSRLPGDVHTYITERDSPVLLLGPGPTSQTVTLRLDPGDLEVVRLPEPAELTNELGSFSLQVEEKDDGTLVVSRSLTIAGAVPSSEESKRYDGLLVEPSDWPLLRALLLEESDPRHRTILLR
jgi:hypothetical protein